MSRRVSEAKKKLIAGKQFYKCANKPELTLRGIDDKCPLWNKSDDVKGSFDESGFEVDHIMEHSVTQDDSENNLQALCISCHRVKTKKFLVKGKQSKEIQQEKKLMVAQQKMVEASIRLLNVKKVQTDLYKKLYEKYGVPIHHSESPDMTVTDTNPQM